MIIAEQKIPHIPCVFGSCAHIVCWISPKSLQIENFSLIIDNDPNYVTDITQILNIQKYISDILIVFLLMYSSPRTIDTAHRPKVGKFYREIYSSLEFSGSDLYNGLI